MVHTWKGQTKEEFLEEVRRDRALTPEQQKKEWDEAMKRMGQIYENFHNIGKIPSNNENKSSKPKADSDEWTYINVEKPNSIDDSVATIYWIIAMVGGAIFNERWVIWIFATVLWLCKIFRHEIRQWKWNNGGKEEYYKKIEDATKRR